MDEVEEPDVGADLDGLRDQFFQGERVRFGEGVEVVHVCDPFLIKAWDFVGFVIMIIFKFLEKSIWKNQQTLKADFVHFTV